MQLLGRTHELHAVDRVLAAARGGRSGVLVIRGEAGIGKTALLRHVVQTADMAVLDAVGVEAERELGFAVLHRLIASHLDRRHTLPAPLRDALEAAFGLAAGVPADPFRVGLAVLTLLAELATERPVLCVCDDVQWADQESLRILGFLARRLDADRVALVLGMRDAAPGEAVPEPLPTAVLGDLPSLSLGGLPAADARALVRRSAGRFDDRELDRVVVEGRGNPLALRELAVEWAHETGGTALAERLPRGSTVEAHFLARARVLPAPVRTLLLVLAADPTSDPDLAWRALVALDMAAGARGLVDAAEPARAAGLLDLDPAPAFTHPLVRSAVYRHAEPEQRRRVHAALADATPVGTDPDRRAWHLAAATPGLDDAVAAELDDAARRARERAGFSAEAAFLPRPPTAPPTRSGAPSGSSPPASRRSRRTCRPEPSSSWNACHPLRARARTDAPCSPSVPLRSTSTGSTRGWR